MSISKTVTTFGLALMTVASTTCLVTAPSARADVTGAADTTRGLGEWRGSGTAHAVGGADLGNFDVSLTRKAVGTNQVRVDGRVVLADGRVITFWQQIDEKAGGGFHIVSNHGEGGGRCFANGMCETYEAAKDGHAYATTIAKDGPDKLRVLVTELDNGRAVRFMDQTLTKR